MFNFNQNLKKTNKKTSDGVLKIKTSNNKLKLVYFMTESKSKFT